MIFVCRAPGLSIRVYEDPDLQAQPTPALAKVPALILMRVCAQKNIKAIVFSSCL